MPGQVPDGVGEPRSGGEPEPRRCDHCGAEYTPTSRIGGSPQRYCSRQCSIAAANARRPYRRGLPPPSLPPNILALPVIPEAIWAEGQCTRPDLPERLRHIWTSDDPAEREMARRACRSCSVQMICRDWALHAVPLDDPAVYGGTGPAARRRMRRTATA